MTSVQLPALPGTMLTRWDPQLLSNGGGGFSASPGDTRGYRMLVSRTGNLRQLMLCVVTASGNIDVGVYDVSVEPRARLWSSGSFVCPGAGWQPVPGTPNINLSRGQNIDIVMACDNSTAKFATVPATGAPGGNGNTMPSNNYWPVKGGSLKLVWFTTAVTVPLGATLPADSSLTATTGPPAVIIGFLSTI